MTKYRLPLFARLEPKTPFTGGRITDTEVLSLADAALMASRHAGAVVTESDFLRAAARGEILLRAIVKCSAKTEPCRSGDALLNDGHPVPARSIPTLPLTACQSLSNVGAATWRTFDCFEEIDGMDCRFTRWQLAEGEPDFETTPDDCRVTGYDVRALADAFLPSSELAEQSETDAGYVQPELGLREASAEAPKQTYADIDALATTRKIANAFPPPNKKTSAQWLKVLGDPPPWLIGARKYPGGKGKTALWNPVEVAIAMISEGNLTKAKAAQIIRDEFSSLNEEWDKSTEYL